jgi:hypothetical protein
MPATSPASSRPAAGEPQVICAVCGTGSQQPPFRSLPPEQAPDLDLRPGEPVRGTMDRWLQQCPHCAYAAPQIAKAHPAAAQAVGAGPFRALIAETSHPPLARRFLAWAHVLEETGALHAAAEATLHAAWVADDLNRPDLARPWRLEAVALWRAGPALEPEQTIRVIDTLRRTAMFDDAHATAEALRRRNPPAVVAEVLALELRLIEARDSGRHTIATALPPPARRPHVSHHLLPGRQALQGGSLLDLLRRLFRRR